MKTLFRRNETYLALIIILFGVLVQARSGQFFTPNNLVDLIVSIIVPGIFCMGMLPVIITGGIDVSFTALASLAIYVTIEILFAVSFTEHILLAFLMCTGIALGLGAANGLLIGILRLPPLIITLGTMSVFHGFMMGVLLASAQNMLPAPLDAFGLSSVFVGVNAESGISSSMPYSIFILIGVVVITWFLLRYTMLGRGIYAVGGNANAASRAGFKIRHIRFFVYCYMGALAGIAAMVRICAIRINPPGNMLGMEMDIIAAVVLGGASLSGGTGNVGGTLLGVGLLQVMSNSLLLIGVPSYWQQFFTGAVIIIGTAITSYRTYRASHSLVDKSARGASKSAAAAR